jgi:hypothetical protein
MKKKIGVAAVLGLLGMAALVPSASATAVCTGTPSPFISFNVDTVFAYETSYNNATYTSAPGSILTVLGKVVCFGSPFNVLAGNNKEYSVVIQVKTVAGTSFSSPIPGTAVYDTDYNDPSGPQSFAIYEDATPDLPGPLTVGTPASALALFDGSEAGVTAILSGTIDYFHTQITKSSTNRWSGSFNALYHSTGGTLYGAVGNGQANLNGLWCSLGTGIQQCTLPVGYSAHPSGKFDQPGTTPTQTTTWGRIKTIYR